MTPEEFNQQYLCNFQPDQRQAALQARLDQYYKDTPDSMPNHEAAKHWRAFKRWASTYGYTQDEIRRAKIASRHN